MTEARANLAAMEAIDDAWNRRDWAAYGGFLADDLVALNAGRTQGRAEHVADAQALCARFPDATVRLPYLDVFASEDGTRTDSVARLTGTDPASGRAFDVGFCVICTRRGGRIVAQRQFVDTETLRRQLGAPSEGSPA